MLDLLDRSPGRTVEELAAAFGAGVTARLLEWEARGRVLIARHVARVNEPIRDPEDLRGPDRVYPRSPPAVLLRKSLLYRSRSALGGYAINPMEGCRHGCRYPCYAMAMMRRFGRVRSYAEWIQPKLAVGAEALLERELDRIDLAEAGPVTLSLTCDPFPYGEPQVAELSLGLIGQLNRRGVPVRVLTKGALPVGLPLEAAGGRPNEFGVSLVSLHENFRRKYEPFAAPSPERVAALRRLYEAGARTWACVEPYPPPSVVEQDLGRLLEALSFVDALYFGRWNYGGAEVRGTTYTEAYQEALDQVTRFCRSRGIACEARAPRAEGRRHTPDACRR
ncbi:MAG: hypothetical protein Kow0092_21450 [Deferrisomatales bacterium]